MGSKERFRPFHGLQWAVPVDPLQLFMHLELYSSISECRMTLDLCRRFGQGPGVGLWDLPNEIKDEIVHQYLLLHFLELDKMPSKCLDDAGKNNHPYFREKAMWIEEKVHSRSEIWQKVRTGALKLRLLLSYKIAPSDRVRCFNTLPIRSYATSTSVPSRTQ